MRNIYLTFLLLLCTLSAFSQEETDTTNSILFNHDVEVEAVNAMNEMYNFKFGAAESKLQELKAKYPTHPIAYYILGLCQWWKTVPNPEVRSYDGRLIAYMDTTIMLAEKIYDKQPKNPDGPFFLAGAYAFKARNYSDRGKWMKAASAAKKSARYTDECLKFKSVTPEVLFGEGMFNYYSVWIREQYPALRPLLIFSKKGNKDLGIKQIKESALNSLYIRTEAQSFLMKIFAEEKKNTAMALEFSRYLATTYPDNAYFQRFHAQMTFLQGLMPECEKVSLDILDKIDSYMIGYESVSGRYASYYLGYIYRNYKQDKEKAKYYFSKSIEFGDRIDAYGTNYYLYSLLNLAKIYDEENDTERAREYYKTIKEKAEKKHKTYKEAVEWLKKHKEDEKKLKTVKKGKGKLNRLEPVSR